LSALGLGLLSGCGANSGPTRQEVAGKVFYDGSPLDNGVIYFNPLDGQASGDGAPITNGDYRIVRDKGLFPGRYRVTIYGGDGAAGTGAAGTGDPARPKPGLTRARERIPPEYNEKSNVIKEVKEGGSNTFEFNIPRGHD
jgi:hypothetical protein